MTRIPFKNVKIQLVTITLCNFIGIGFSAPQFGFDFAPPIHTGFENLAPPVFKQNKNEQKASDPFGSLDPFSSKDNLFKPNLFTPTPPAPNIFVDDYKKITELPIEVINKLNSDKNNSVTDAPVKLNSRGSFSDDSSKVSKSTQRTAKKTVSERTEDTLVTLAWLDDSDYTTETSEYETTTDETGHIGGPAPAVVASLLG